MTGLFVEACTNGNAKVTYGLGGRNCQHSALWEEKLLNPIKA